jgi:hypothetical protein
MARRWRARRFFKRVLTTAVVCLAATIALSFIWRVDWHAGPLDVAVSKGAAYVWWEHGGNQYEVSLSSHLWVYLGGGEDVGQFFTEGIQPFRYRYSVEWDDIDWWFHDVGLPFSSTSYFACLPLWMPLAVLLLPTLLLHLMDPKRIPASHCQACGYNLAGNVSGRCPECGAAVPATPTRPPRTWRQWAWAGARFTANAARGRTAVHEKAATWIRLMLILFWHWTAIPATQGIVYRMLPGRRDSTDWLIPPIFDVGAYVDHLLLPITSSALAMLLLGEGVACGLVFRWLRPCGKATFSAFILAWCWACLWGTLVLPAVSVVVAVLSRNRGLAMQSVALWIVLAPVLVAIRRPTADPHSGTPAKDGAESAADTK